MNNKVNQNDFCAGIFQDGFFLSRAANNFLVGGSLYVLVEECIRIQGVTKIIFRNITVL